MNEMLQMKPELRYGCPVADQVLMNRFFTVGYSYYFRQPKWAMEVVDPNKELMNNLERAENFRPDFRIPARFRADLSDFEGSGYARGHMVASANHNDTEIQNSETFLLSNMCPQLQTLNNGKWKQLKKAVRKLDSRKKVLVTYVISGPLFDFSQPITMIGKSDNNGVEIPIPSHFFKCILTESSGVALNMWAFEMPNKKLDGTLKDYQVTVEYIEQRAGFLLWSELQGVKIEKEKRKKRKIWSY